jgi:hypothetical protein
MTDRPTQTFAKHASPEEAREIRYLAEHTDLSPNQAQDLVKKHGTDRARLLEAAKTIKAES